MRYFKTIKNNLSFKDKETEKKYNNLEKELLIFSQLKQDVEKEIEKIKSEQLIDCQNCKELIQIKDLTYIQTHWYVQPYSCAGGDYWKAGEGQFDCIKCGHRNRLYESPEVEKYRRLFKKIIDEY